jgi:hypothetical protein
MVDKIISFIEENVEEVLNTILESQNFTFLKTEIANWINFSLIIFDKKREQNEKHS